MTPKRFTLDELLRESDYESIDEDADEIPEKGDVVRTKKMQMEGKVEKMGKNRAGYDEVFFRIDDGRLMKTPLDNVIIITKLADCDSPMMEAILNEISNEVLAKYKKAAGKDASKADKEGDTERGNKRFKGIVKATKKQFDNDKKKSSTNESRYEYDKKSGEMRPNHKDPDQRHGLYIDGKLSKTYNTKEEADNVKKRDPRYKDAVIKKIAEGSMGGINRVPNLGLKYDKVLDEVKKRWRQESNQK